MCTVWVLMGFHGFSRRNFAKSRVLFVNSWDLLGTWYRFGLRACVSMLICGLNIATKHINLELQLNFFVQHVPGPIISPKIPVGTKICVELVF